VIHDYATAPLIFEVRGLPAKPDAPALSPSNGAPAAATAGMSSAEAAGAAAGSMDKYRGVSIGNIIDCEGGSIVITGYFEATALDRAGKVIKEFKGKDRLMANFIDIIRSRKTADLYGPIEEGHISSALCHVGNISHQLGAKAMPGKLQDEVKGDAPLAEAVGRMTEHLAVNGVDLKKTRLTLGQPLTIHPKAERFTGSGAKAANKLLTRKYRAPFTVPQIA